MRVSAIYWVALDLLSFNPRAQCSLYHLAGNQMTGLARSGSACKNVLENDMHIESSIWTIYI